MTTRRIKLRRRNAKGERIGYGVPPDETKFKPGKSGNPKGRPKGSKNESTILRELLEAKMTVRIGGRERKIPVMEGIHRRNVESALKGDLKASAFLLNRYGAMVTGELAQDELGDDDKEVLAAFAKRFASGDKQ